MMAGRASRRSHPGEKENRTEETSWCRPLVRGTPHWTGTQVSSAVLWPANGTN